MDNRPLVKAVSIPEFSDEGGGIPNLPVGTDEAEPFPTVLIITASGVSLAVVTAGVLVYFKKRKRNDEPKISQE